MIPYGELGVRDRYAGGSTATYFFGASSSVFNVGHHSIDGGAKPFQFFRPLTRETMKPRKVFGAVLFLRFCVTAGAADRKYIVNPRSSDRQALPFSEGALIRNTLNIARHTAFFAFSLLVNGTAPNFPGVPGSRQKSCPQAFVGVRSPFYSRCAQNFGEQAVLRDSVTTSRDSLGTSKADLGASH